MRAKVVAIAAASVFTVGMGAHISHYCLLKQMVAKTTNAAAPKDAKTALVAKR